MATRRSNPGRTPSTARPTTPAEPSASPEVTARATRARAARRPIVDPSAAPRVSAEHASAGRVSGEARQAMIAKAAYLRAERRGFAPGREEEDWLAAEKEVDALLSAGQGARQ
jgi:hypothetical protein